MSVTTAPARVTLRAAAERLRLEAAELDAMADALPEPEPAVVASALDPYPQPMGDYVVETVPPLRFGPDERLTNQELLAWLKRSRSTLSAWRRHKGFPAPERDGRTPRAAVVRWLEENKPDGVAA